MLLKVPTTFLYFYMYILVCGLLGAVPSTDLRYNTNAIAAARITLSYERGHCSRVWVHTITAVIITMVHYIDACMLRLTDYVRVHLFYWIPSWPPSLCSRCGASYCSWSQLIFYDQCCTWRHVRLITADRVTIGIIVLMKFNWDPEVFSEIRSEWRKTLRWRGVKKREIVARRRNNLKNG